MITVYESPACLSCRKAKSWLKENELEYRSVDILKKPLKEPEIRHLLELAWDVYDVVSLRSKPVISFTRTYGMDLEDLTFKELLSFLHKNPNAIKRPLLTNGKILVSGYDLDELTVLLPREKRRVFCSSRIEISKFTL